MNSYRYDIGEQARVGSRFISHVRRELQAAFAAEKAAHKVTQQDIATKLGVNRSVINRQLGGLENMTLRSVAELLWAIGWEPLFSATRIPVDDGANDIPDIGATRQKMQTTTSDTVDAPPGEWRSLEPAI